jgi:hypothetical protein
VPEISGPNNVPGKRPDAELGKIEPTPGGWNQMPAKNKEREACLNPNPQISTPPDRKRPQQAETKRRKLATATAKTTPGTEENNKLICRQGKGGLQERTHSASIIAEARGGVGESKREKAMAQVAKNARKRSSQLG